MLVYFVTAQMDAALTFKLTAQPSVSQCAVSCPSQHDKNKRINRNYVFGAFLISALLVNRNKQHLSSSRSATYWARVRCVSQKNKKKRRN